MARRDPKKSLLARPRDYDVGYGKPPVHSRFQPGQSGNPSGRPKGSRKKSSVPALNEERLKSIILEEAYRSIRVHESSQQVSLTMAQAIIRSLAVNAAKGNQRAQRLFTELLVATEQENKRLHDEWLNTAIEYKVEWEKELRRRAQLGITDAPAPLPHPDDVVIDMRTGSIRITGPMTREEKQSLDMLAARRHEAEKEILRLEGLLRDPSHRRHRKQILEELKHEKKILDVIAGGLDAAGRMRQNIGV